MNKKSIKLNAVFSLIQMITSLIFPLITFPYISRIFGVNQLGQYNYAKNFVEIFAAIALLGIPTYAQREGAKVRNNREKISRLMSQIFDISMIANIIVLIILFAIIGYFESLRMYGVLIAIFSITIPLTTVGMSWLFVIYEDYNFSMWLGIGFNTLSLIAMFLFVRTKEDIYIYAIITVLASCGANIVRFIYGRKYCKIRIFINLDLKKHFGPILILFAIYISVLIYNRIDTAMLGLMKSEYNVGIYSVSTKIYSLVKSCLLSLSTVLQTKAVIFASSKDKKKSDYFLSKSFNSMILFVIPCVIGMAFMHRDIILFIAGRDFLDAGTSLIILSVALFFALFSTLHSSTILIPHGKEKITLIGAIIGAVENFVLNLFFIPLWGENGAAFTTLIAEVTVFLVYYNTTKKLFTHNHVKRMIIECLIGCVGIVVVLSVFENIGLNIIAKSFIEVSLSVLAFVCIEYLIKNEIICELVNDLIEKVQIRKGVQK